MRKSVIAPHRHLTARAPRIAPHRTLHAPHPTAPHPTARAPLYKVDFACTAERTQRVRRTTAFLTPPKTIKVDYLKACRVLHPELEDRVRPAALALGPRHALLLAEEWPREPKAVQCGERGDLRQGASQPLVTQAVRPLLWGPEGSPEQAYSKRVGFWSGGAGARPSASGGPLAMLGCPS